MIDLPDSVLYLYDQDGTTILELNDDISWPDNPGSRIAWIAEGTGTYYLEVTAYDSVEIGDYTLAVVLVNNVPVIQPIDDQAMAFQEEAIAVTLTATDRDDDPLTLSAEILATGPLAQLAHDLDQELGLYRHSAGYMENLFGAGEKFMHSNYGWQFILPNGEFYAWTGSIESSLLRATLDAGYHADPTLLHEALPPTVHDGDVTMTLVGNQLTIDPADGYVGSFQVRVSVTDGTDTTTGLFEVHREAPPATDLGTVDLMQIADLDLTGGDLLYRLQTTGDGFLSVLADYEASAGSAQLMLYDGNFDLLATDGLRIDFDAGAGETFYVGLAGASPSVTLRLANLVLSTGDNVVAYGTAGADVFEFSAGETYDISINSINYQFASGSVAYFGFQGGLGADSAVLTGSVENDTVVMYPNRTVVSGVRYRVTVEEVTQTDFTGGGTDTVQMYDSAGDDRLVATMADMTLSGDGFRNEAHDFR